MSRDIQVILLEHIPTVGQAGDIVAVSEGYARNALFPEGKAALATDQRTREHQQKKQKIAKKRAATMEELRDLGEKFESTELVMVAKVKEGEDIYGSIKKPEIIKELASRSGLHIKPKQLKVKEPIKRLGSYELTITLDPEVEFIMKLTVAADTSGKQDEDDEA